MRIEDIENICVIGAGAMGHQIAMLCALGGFHTILQDVEETALQKAEFKLRSIMDTWKTLRTREGWSL